MAGSFSAYVVYMGRMYVVMHLFYTCTCICLNMQCERRSALETYFDLLNADTSQPLLALIGCGCSLATEPVAEITNFNDIVHVRVPLCSDI